jgi:acyl carrier protein
MNEKQLLPILADTLGVEVSALSQDTSTENTPAWDSVAHLNLVLSLEQAFGQRFTPEEFMQMQSVMAIQRVLAAHGVP